jgi:3-phosphoshikimate 1-carboxyvinyltransferase
MGAEIVEYPDGFRIESRPLRGAVVDAAGDHRLAMAFAVLGTVPGARIAIDDMQCADVSFPRFGETLAGIRAGSR